MLGYLFKRLAGGIAVLIAVSLFTFVLLDLTPGDAATALAGEAATTEELNTLRHKLGLDAPLGVRYGRYIAAALLRGDFGRSLVSGRPVGNLLFERFGYTAQLALAALAVALAIGSAAGLAAARRPGRAADAVIMGLTGLGISLPTFWVAMLLITLFSLRLRWLPVVGAGGPQHLLLPATALALPTAAVVARLVRSSLLDVSHADYVRTARAKGVPERAVWHKHILRNGVQPVLTVMGLHLGHMLGGTFIIETIFAWPGLGRLIVQAVFDRDYPIIVGAVLLMALIYQTLNLAVDLAHAWLDPRVGHNAL